MQKEHHVAIVVFESTSDLVGNLNDSEVATCISLGQNSMAIPIRALQLCKQKRCTIYTLSLKKYQKVQRILELTSNFAT